MGKSQSLRRPADACRGFSLAVPRAAMPAVAGDPASFSYLSDSAVDMPQPVMTRGVELEWLSGAPPSPHPRLQMGRCKGDMMLEQLNGQGDVAMLMTDDVLQRMYDLAYSLHPDNGIALAVTLDACERITLLRRMQDRRGGHYKFRLPEACLPQSCVYLASDAREREQERRRLGKEPRYRPSADDYLMRYIKFLVWWTMDRNACHVAVALGCFLYGYQPGDIADLAPEIFNHHNIRRVKRRLALQLQARFQSANIVADEHHTLCTRAPTAHERQLVGKALALFTPWGVPHVPAPSPDRSVLETHFDGVSPRSDWERIHALIDPACAGLPRLVREYNESFSGESTARLEDPDHALAIPCFNV